MLAKVERLRGVIYAWGEGAEGLGYTPGQKDIGVIAQEVEAVFPELVTTAADGYKAVNYDKLSAVLLEAIKAQSQEVRELQVVVERLKP